MPVDIKDPNFQLEAVARVVLGLEYPGHFTEWGRLTSLYSRVLLLASRDHGKTTFFDKIFPITKILSNKAYKILIVSYSDTQVLKIGSDIKATFDSRPLLKEFSPKSDEDWSKSRMLFRDGSLIETLAFGSTGRGGHYDLILVDDPVKDFGGMDPDEQSQYFTRTITPMCKPDGQIIITGNYIYDGDLIDRIERNKAYRTVKYPCIKEDGKALWPEYWPLDKLAERRREVESGDDPFGFVKEYLLQKVDTKAQFFQRSMFKFYDPDRMPELTSRVASWDPAISLNGDFNAMMVTATDEKKVTRVLPEYAEFRADNVKALIDEQFRLTDLYDIPYWIVEVIGFQKLLKEHINDAMRERTRFFGIKEIKHHVKSKQARIMALQPRIVSGALLFHPTAHEDIIKQFCAFPRGQHDDMCLAGETLIATPQGDRRIDSLSEGDEVITPIGNRRVEAWSLTGFKTVKEFRGIRGTGNHPIFRDGYGFVAIDAFTSLMRTDNLSLWNMIRWGIRKMLYSTDDVTGSWGRGAITSVSQHRALGGRILLDFMCRFGSIITEEGFQKASMFITKMAILLITILQTWIVYRLRNITRYLRESIGSALEKILRTSVLLPPSGISQTREENGIKNMLGNNGKTPRSSSEGAKIVSKNLNRSIATADSVLNGAEQGSVAVYNIKINGAGCYYANRILVSNCDALASMLPDWDKPNPPKVSSPPGSWQWWHSQIEDHGSDWYSNFNN